MRNSKFNFTMIAFVMVAVFTGMYLLMRPPAPKPELPAPPAPQETPGPVPGVPPFDAGKYRTEPNVSVWIAEKGQITTMPLEQYLEGVIAREMEPDWPQEALAAQAIVSRTLTVSAMESGTIRRLHHADVSTAKEELQAYAPERINDNVREAVRRTRGQIILYGGGLVNAVYSSCNGQVGATKEESFPGEQHAMPYLQPVPDDCFEYAPAKEQSWTVKIPANEVMAAVNYHGNPADIRILQQGPSGRALFIGAGDKKVYGSDFRRLLGYDRVRSTLITDMKYDGAYFVLSGLGWGNGAGFCQWGAYTFAQKGWKAEEIVKYYYVGTEIKKIWE